MQQRQIPYGIWNSPMTAKHLSEATLGLQDVACSDKVYWIEAHPWEKGRVALYTHTDSGPHELFPEASIRSRVHEYGGGAFAVWKERIIYVDDVKKEVICYAKGKSVALARESDGRFADFSFCDKTNTFYAVHEVHYPDGRVENSLACLSTRLPVRTVASGKDFYSSPRVSPDGKHLCWITWDLPAMPWDETTLWLADISPDGTLANIRCVERQTRASIIQPAWGPDGHLYCLSDRTGWWNLYRVSEKKLEPLCPMDAEFGLPPWVFGRPTYAFMKEAIACIYTEQGVDKLGILSLKNKHFQTFDVPFNTIRSVCATANRLYFLASSDTLPLSLISLNPETGDCEVLRASSEDRLNDAMISRAIPISYPTYDKKEGYGFYYPPKNANFQSLPGELPPLIVRAHGGPTAHVTSGLNLETQYWTTRGFAVVDVNYGGSTGYGRAYRERLQGNWGICDVQDCIYAANFLVALKKADPRRLFIRGGSAGGYTVLCALAFHNVFAAGASYYGVADLEKLAEDTHKFELRYNDGLIGPKKLWKERSPIYSAKQINVPLLLLQGSEDTVVPPNQSEMIYDALKQAHIPVTYLLFEGEGHGFRKADSQERALEAEYEFYKKRLNRA